jgi:hypothetical protein
VAAVAAGRSTPHIDPSLAATQEVLLGAFYTNITVRAPSPQAVLPLLAGRRAFVSPGSNGWVTIYDEQCEEGDSDPAEFAAQLSGQIGTLAFLVTVHDDDILYFDVFDQGAQVDEYDSCPNYFSEEDDDDGDIGFLPPEGGDPELLCRAFGCTDRPALEEALYTQDQESRLWIFASERHRALAGLLGLPAFSVGFGYKYLAQGEVPEGLSRNDLIEVR